MKTFKFKKLVFLLVIYLSQQAGAMSVQQEQDQDVGTYLRELVEKRWRRLGANAKTMKELSDKEYDDMIRGAIDGDEDARIALLHNAKHHRNPAIRTSVCAAAAKLEDRGEATVILNYLKLDKEPWVRGHVALAAGKLGGEEGLDLLNYLVQDENDRVLEHVIYGAEDMGGDEGATIVRQLVGHESEIIRYRIFEAEMGTFRHTGGEEVQALIEEIDQFYNRSWAWKQICWAQSQEIRMCDQFKHSPWLKQVVDFLF